MTSLASIRRVLRPAAIGLAAVAGVMARPHDARAADPTMAECLSANESAIALRRDHKLRQARVQSLTCAALSCPGEVRDVCQARVRDISAAIPTVVFLAQDAEGHDVVNVRVSIDGAPLGDRLDGTALPVDPGEHTFAFDADGHPRVERGLVVGEGQKDRRETIVLPDGAASSPEGPAVMPPAAGAAPPPSDTGAGATADAGRGARVIGLAVGGVGVLGLGVGLVTGIVAATKWSSAKSACNGQTMSCTTDPGSIGTRDESSAKTFATVADAGLIAGAAMVAIGAVVYFTAPKGPASAPRTSLSVAPWVTGRDTGIVLEGAF